MSKLLTRREVAEKCSLHPQTVWKWAKSGRFPPPSARAGGRGGYQRWYESVVEDWLAGRWKPKTRA